MTNGSNILFINTLLYACPIDNFIVSYLTKVTSNIVFNPNTQTLLLALIFLTFLLDSKVSSHPERTRTEDG